jgi:carbamoyltransferase
MYILGLNFGHDASVAVIRDGVVLSFESRERRCGRKHVAGLGLADIEQALATAGVSLADIELCAVTTSQEMEVMTPRADGIDLRFGDTPSHPVRSPFLEQQLANGKQLALSEGYVVRVLSDPDAYDSADREWARRMVAGWPIEDGPPRAFPGIDQFIAEPSWQGRPGLAAIASTGLPGALADIDARRFSFHVPVTLTLRDRAIPGYFTHHHVAHAASTYYLSGFQQAAVLTHDGYGLQHYGPNAQHDYNSGFFYFGIEERLYPLFPNYLTIGHLYSMVSVQLGLGDALSGPGKLMGLSSYGRPRFFEKRFVGNEFDLLRLTDRHPEQGTTQTWLLWWEHCLDQARKMGYDMSALADPWRITEPVNVDIAASTQLLLEECYLRSAEVLQGLLGRLSQETGNLCLSGGTALNCPSNTRLFNEGPFRQVFVEPACDDSGLAIGAALHLFHNLLGNPRAKDTSRQFDPYLGTPPVAGEIADAIAAYGSRVSAQQLEPTDFVERAATELAENRVLALYTGRGEIGPRALCHRSILAHPGFRENWARCNEIKRRESWRPFAPVVLEAEAHRWFSQAPAATPYMLFNAHVSSDRLPAVTHVDGSSRIQTVGESAGVIFDILQRFGALTGLPVLVNTSLNGPGQPIIDTPQAALEFLVGTEVDALYIDGWRVTRA